MNDFYEMFQVAVDHERQCEVCKLYGDCAGGVRGGPDGPIFPACCDSDPANYVDEVYLEDVYNEIMEEAETALKGENNEADFV